MKTMTSATCQMRVSNISARSRTLWSALAVLCPLLALRADCNISGNVVGYVHVTLPSNPSRVLIANPFNGVNNHLNTILPLPATAEGTAIYRWNASDQAFGDPIVFASDTGWHSDNPDPNWLVLDPGEGFFIQNSTEAALPVTLVGQVPEGVLTTPIPVGFSYLASKVPQPGPLGQAGAAGTLQFPATDGDIVSFWDVGSQDFSFFMFLEPFWDPWDPLLGVAEGFKAQKSTPGVWTRNFMVSCPTGPLLGIRLLAAGNVEVAWTATDWGLQEATDPAGPWSAVAGNPTSPYVTQPITAKKFFRLAGPCVVIVCPTNMVVNCASPDETPAFFNPTATNVCAGTDVPVTCTPTSGSLFPLGTTTVTCVATADGETNSCSFTVTVEDTTAPSITCPPNLIVNQDPGLDGKANVNYSATATDACAGTNVHLTFSIPSGSTFPVGTTPVTCWAWDDAGNTNTCSFTVTVNPCGPNSCPASYTLTFPMAGYYYLANHVDMGRYNSLAEVLPYVPDGTRFMKWDPCAQDYGPELTFYAGAGWAGARPSSVIFGPGEGAKLFVPGSCSLTFTGLRRCAAQLPLVLVQGWQFVGNQQPEPGTFESIVGAPPVAGTQVRRLIEGAFVRYDYDPDVGWSPEPPVASVGEAWELYSPVATRDCGPAYWPVTSYTITVPSGWSFIANQLEKGANTLNEVFSNNVPAGATLRKWDSGAQDFGPVQVYSAGGWLDLDGNPSTVTLKPGEGAMLDNPGPGFSLTFTGKRRFSRHLPPSLMQGMQCLSDQLPEPGTFTSIVGLPPVSGTQVRRLLPNGTYSTHTYTDASGWDPTPPMANVGEAWLVSLPCDMRLICRDKVVTIEAAECSATVTFDNIIAPCATLFACDPPSGSIFPLGSTLVHCSVTNPVTGYGASGTFNVIVKKLDIALGGSPGETVIAWPEWCPGTRLQYADALRCCPTEAWWTVAGASSPHVDLSLASHQFQAALTCVPGFTICSPSGFKGRATCALTEGTNLQVHLKFYRQGGFDTNSGLIGIHRACQPQSLVYSLSDCPVTDLGDGWYELRCQQTILVEQLQQLQAGEWSIMVSNSANAAICGPIERVHRNFSAVLTCDQVVPGSTLCDRLLTGQASCSLEGTYLRTRVRFYSPAYQPGDSTIRIYGPASPGQAAANPLYVLSCATPEGTQCWYEVECETALTNDPNDSAWWVADQVEQLLGGLWYITIHTSQGEEIRGQIEPVNTRFFRWVQP